MAGKTHSNPILQQTIALQTEHAQRVHHRGFSRTSNSLHRVDVVLQLITDQESVDEVEKIIDDLFSQYLDDITREHERLNALMSSNGINSSPKYTNPVELNVDVSSPQVSRLIRVLTEFDSLVVAIDTLWLYGLFNNKQRKEVIYEWQRRSLRLGNRIVDIEQRAQRAAHNNGKDDEVAKKLGDTPAPDKASEADEDDDASQDEPDVADTADSKLVAASG